MLETGNQIPKGIQILNGIWILFEIQIIDKKVQIPPDASQMGKKIQIPGAGFDPPLFHSCTLLFCPASSVVGPDQADLPKFLLAESPGRGVEPEGERDAADPDGADGGHEPVGVEQLRGEQSL